MLLLSPYQYELGPHRRLGKGSVLRENLAHSLMSVWKPIIDDDRALFRPESLTVMTLAEIETKFGCPDLYPSRSNSANDPRVTPSVMPSVLGALRSMLSLFVSRRCYAHLRKYVSRLFLPWRLSQSPALSPLGLDASYPASSQSLP